MYKKIEIGNLVTLRQGFAINKKTNHHMSEEPTQLHLLRIGDMKDGKFSIFVKDTIPEKFIAKEDDIIYTRTGQVGLVFRKQHGVVHNNCFTVTSNDLNILQQEFLFYALQEKSFYEEAISRATGAAQPDLPHGAFNSIQIFLPPIESQKKISNILNTYDNLIENNQKQIKLLEEVAQRLYKEWFVDLRFPGHESTKIIDGIPEEWNKGSLSNIALFKRGKTVTKAQVEKGDIPVVAGGLKPAYYHNKANTVAPVITVSGSGANAGYTKLYNIDVFASDCSFADSKTTPNLFFVYCFLKNNKEIVNSLQKGAAQPHVYAKDINSINLLVPNTKLINKFCKLVAPYFEKIKILENQNKLTSQARDRLLPKLVNGELEV